MQVSILFLTVAALSAGKPDITLHQNVMESTDGCPVEATLLCTVTPQEKDFTVLNISWIKDSGNQLLCNGHQKTAKDSSLRVQCHYNHHKHLTLTIKNLNETDNGKYICKLITNSGHALQHISLNLTVCDSANTARQRLQRNTATISEGKWRPLLFSLTAIFFIFH